MTKMNLKPLNKKLAYPVQIDFGLLLTDLEKGLTVDEIFEFSKIDPWFLVQIKDLVDQEKIIENQTLSDLDQQQLYDLKRKGFSDSRIASIIQATEEEVRNFKK